MNTPEEMPKDIVDLMFQAQYGSRADSEWVQQYMIDYFKRWYTYRHKLTHLEWYHLFIECKEAADKHLKEQIKKVNPLPVIFINLNKENEDLKQKVADLYADAMGQADWMQMTRDENVKLKKENAIMKTTIQQFQAGTI